MSIERYRDLVEQLAAQFVLVDAQDSEQVTRLHAYGSQFSLYFGGVLSPDSVLLHCDFGDVPLAAREPILRRLLELNTYLFSIRHSAFTYDAGRDCIVLMCRFDLAQATLALLKDVFVDVAAMTHQWRGDHFLAAQTTSFH